MAAFIFEFAILYISGSLEISLVIYKLVDPRQNPPNHDFFNLLEANDTRLVLFKIKKTLIYLPLQKIVFGAGGLVV